MLQVILDLISVQKVGWLIEAAKPLRVYLEEFLALFKLLYLTCLYNTDVLFVLDMS